MKVKSVFETNESTSTSPNSFLSNVKLFCYNLIIDCSDSEEGTETPHTTTLCTPTTRKKL